jgi:hypothetical protein
MVSVYFLAGTICYKTIRPAVVSTQPPFQLITWVLSTQVKQPARVVIPLTIFRKEVKMSGVLLLLPLYAIKVWTGTTLPFTIIR